MNLQYKVHKPIDFVFDYLTDMQKFASVHPVISKIDNMRNDTYLVHETLTLATFPFSFTYPVYIKSNIEKTTVVLNATVMKITQITMTFILRPENEFTLINETVNFKTILPVKSIMQSIFRKQHEQLFRNIDALAS